MKQAMIRSCLTDQTLQRYNRNSLNHPNMESFSSFGRAGNIDQEREEIHPVQVQETAQPLVNYRYLGDEVVLAGTLLQTNPTEGEEPMITLTVSRLEEGSTHLDSSYSDAFASAAHYTSSNTDDLEPTDFMEQTRHEFLSIQFGPKAILYHFYAVDRND